MGEWDMPAELGIDRRVSGCWFATSQRSVWALGYRTDWVYLPDLLDITALQQSCMHHTVLSAGASSALGWLVAQALELSMTCLGCSTSTAVVQHSINLQQHRPCPVLLLRSRRRSQRRLTQPRGRMTPTSTSSSAS